MNTTNRNDTIQKTSYGSLNLALRSYMQRIYNYMASGLAISGFVAYAIATSPAAIQVIFGTPLVYVVMFLPLVMVITLSARIHKMSAASAQVMFWLYAAAVGASLSSILLLYTATSVARVFFITAGMFATTSIYGYTTKRDISGFGGALTLAVVGIIIASITNMFVQSGGFQMLISAVTVLVFSGLVAYDTQNLKDLFYHMHGQSRETVEKASIIGALRLFMDFINMFVAMIRLFGDRR
ncbi:MAG: Bax inhibitor-1/YccA family protein [Alphaproteobacteria bacterium]|nr:MAG: Bax inhibitor-1/YccA family protein [Alphaproteobacteria bacterium]